MNTLRRGGGVGLNVTFCYEGERGSEAQRYVTLCLNLPIDFWPNLAKISNFSPFFGQHFCKNFKFSPDFDLIFAIFGQNFAIFAENLKKFQNFPTNFSYIDAQFSC